MFEVEAKRSQEFMERLNNINQKVVAVVVVNLMQTNQMYMALKVAIERRVVEETLNNIYPKGYVQSMRL